MKKIIICGNYGGVNTGDEAMLEGLLSVLKGRAEITVLSHNPDHTAKFHEVQSLHVAPMGLRSFLKHSINGEVQKTNNAVKNSDLFILGGGGLFTDEENDKAPAMWGAQAKMAIKYNKPLVMLGQSVGPLKNTRNKQMSAEFFSGAEYVSVRDEASKRMLEELGINGIQTFPDLAFLASEKYSNVQADTSCKGKVLFIPRDWEANSKMNEIKVMLTSKYGSRLKILSLYRSRESFEDENLDRSGCSMPEEVISKIKAADMVISMRLHGNILASIAQTPFVAISYSDKVRGFCDSIGHGSCVDLDAKLEDIEKVIMHLEQNHTDNHLPESIQKLISKQKEMILDLA